MKLRIVESNSVILIQKQVKRHFLERLLEPGETFEWQTLKKYNGSRYEFDTVRGAESHIKKMFFPNFKVIKEIEL